MAILFSFVASTALVDGAQRPNIVLIVADDLGYGDLSIQGAEDLQTPNIDRIFNEGMTFNNFYANCPVCSPSRASLLTGRYPDLVGVPGVIRTGPNSSWGYLSPDAKLLPELLNEFGYESAIIGKWHLGIEEENKPNSRGFDYFKGFLCNFFLFFCFFYIKKTVSIYESPGKNHKSGILRFYVFSLFRKIMNFSRIGYHQKIVYKIAGKSHLHFSRPFPSF